MKQLIEPHEYPLLRYREATTPGVKKGWLDFIQRFKPDLYQQIMKEEQTNG